MSYLGIIIAFLLGASFVATVIGKFSFLEILGFSFPAGMGIITIAMFLLDVSGFAITRTNLLWVIVLSILVLNYKLFISPRNTLGKFKTTNYKVFFYVGKFNLVWLLFVGVVLLILIGITIKSLYWPTAASDSISSFDLFGKVIASEGKLMNSLIYEKRVGFGAAYPPLYALSLAYSYIFGFEMSKIIPVLFFISFVISFYALSLRNVSSLGAIVGTFFFMISPELLAQSAINTTSITQAMYGALGIIAILTWNNTKEKKYLLLSVLMVALNGWIRSEGIVYIGAAFLFYSYITIREKEYIKPILFLLVSMLPFVLWQLFLKSHIDLMDQFVQVEIKIIPNFDGDYISRILFETKKNFFHKIYFGITVYVFMGAIVLNFIWFFLKKESLVTLIVVLIPLIAYLLLLNQLVLRADSIEGIMRSSAKRFFFGTITLMWFYAAQVYPVKTLFSKIETYLGIPKAVKKQ
jgi:hypothetical protein